MFTLLVVMLLSTISVHAMQQQTTNEDFIKKVELAELPELLQYHRALDVHIRFFRSDEENEKVTASANNALTNGITNRKRGVKTTGKIKTTEAYKAFLIKQMQHGLKKGWIKALVTLEAYMAADASPVKHIHWENSHLTQLPEGIEQCTRLTQLETISFKNNKLTKVDPRLALLTQVRTLDLSGNPIRIAENRDVLKQLTHLRELKLDELSPTDTEAMQKLTGATSSALESK